MKKLLLATILVLAASVLLLPACGQPDGGAETSPSESNRWLELMRVIPENEDTATTFLQTEDYEAFVKEEYQEAIADNDMVTAKFIVHNRLPMFQSTSYSDDEWDETLGFNVNDLTDSIVAMNLPPTSYQAMRGDFTEQDVANAVRTGPLNEHMETISYKGHDIYAWGDDFDIHMDWRSGLRPLGRGYRLAYVDGYAFWMLWTEGIEQLIDAYEGDIPSLADNEDFQLMAAVLEEENTAAAFFSSAPLSVTEIHELFDSRFDDMIREGKEELVEEFNSGPFLKPYSALATAPGKDEQGTYMVIVLVNPDESTAKANADLLEQRLNETDIELPFFPKENRKWTDGGYVENMEITARGRLTVAKLYGRVYTLWDEFDFVTGAYKPLLIHE